MERRIKLLKAMYEARALAKARMPFPWTYPQLQFEDSVLAVAREIADLIDAQEEIKYKRLIILKWLFEAADAAGFDTVSPYDDFHSCVLMTVEDLIKEWETKNEIGSLGDGKKQD